MRDIHFLKNVMNETININLSGKKKSPINLWTVTFV